MSEKGNNVFTTALIIILSMFIGFSLGTRGGSNPAVKEISQQQSDVLHALKRVEKMIDEEEDENGSRPGYGRGDLHDRVTALEAKLDILLGRGAPGGLKGSPQAAPQGPPAEDYDKVYDIAVAHSPVRGNKNAPVTIVEFVDFQCPFCARFHPPLNEVLKAYPDKVNYMAKNFPLSFHPEARPAAKAAFAAGEQGKYWEMFDLILEDNSQLNANHYQDLAKKLGLNMDKFNKDLKDNNSKYEKWIDEDLSVGSRVQVRGTPTFYINGKKTTARSFPQYKTVIDEILSNQ